MKRFKKPTLSESPLSKNIAEKLHYKQRSDAGFKAEVEKIVGNIEKTGEEISDQTILSWIAADKKNPRFPSKNPKPENLEKLAIAMGLKSLWDFYVDRDRWINKEYHDNLSLKLSPKLSSTQKKVIDKISKIINKKHLRELNRYVDYILTIGNIDDEEENKNIDENEQNFKDIKNIDQINKFDEY